MLFLMRTEACLGMREALTGYLLPSKCQVLSGAMTLTDDVTKLNNQKCVCFHLVSHNRKLSAKLLES